MGTFGWVTMIMVALVMIMPGFFLINGKGVFLIAGYNTMSLEKRARYDEKALCKFVGWLLIIYTLGLMSGVCAFAFDIIWLGSLIMILIHIALIGALIYVNTGKRMYKKNDDGTPVDISSITITKEEQEKFSKSKKTIINVTVSIIAVILLGFGLLFYFGEQEPVVDITSTGIDIRAMYGTSISFSEITDIILIETSIRDIGINGRMNGYGGFGTTLKGYFNIRGAGNSLLFVKPASSPTIHITGKNVSDIFISFADGEKTRDLYSSIVAEFIKR